MSAERARRLFVEVDRAARRLEQLAEGRRERLRDLARVRALEDETAQVSTTIPCDTDDGVGYAVGQLVEALRYKPEVRRFDSRWGHCDFSLT